MCAERGPQRDERGAAAVEYAVVTVAAASLGGALIAITLDPFLDGRLARWFLQLIGWILRQFGIA